MRRDGGTDRPVSTATLVMNALSAEPALHEKLGAKGLKPAGIADVKRFLCNRNCTINIKAKSSESGLFRLTLVAVAPKFIIKANQVENSK